MNTQQEIYTAGHLAAAGKTWDAINFSVAIAKRGRRILIAMPTVALIEETLADKNHFQLNGFNRLSAVNVVAIYSKVHQEESVTAQLCDTLKSAPRGSIVFCTHKALMKLNFSPTSREWNLICDEIPSVVDYKFLSLDKHREELLSMFETVPHNDQYERVIANNFTREAFENKSQDQFWRTKYLEELTHFICSDHWDVYAPVHDNKDYAKFHAILRPTFLKGFETVTFMGAGFDLTLLSKIWRNSVTFTEHPDIKPRYNVHENAHLLTLLCVTEDAYSKTKQKRECHGGGRFIEEYAKKANDYFDGKRYIYSANNDFQHQEKMISGVRISNVSHGLNSYTDHNAYVQLSALNETPEQLHFLKHVCQISSSEVFVATNVLTAYQNIMRMSLRDPSSTNECMAIVPDKRIVDVLVEGFFPNANLIASSLVPDVAAKKMSSKKIHASKLAANAASRQHIIDGLVEELDEINSQDAIGPYNSLRNRPHLDRNNYFVSPLLLKSRSDRYGCRLPSKSLPDFIVQLKDWHTITYKSKEDNSLITPSIYDPNKSEDANRAIENIVYADGIWLDHDGGDLDKGTFASIFPTIEMHIFNSFSCGKDGKQRWRVYIPTSHYMSAKAYEHIIRKVIIQRLAERKYYGKKYLAKHPDAKSHGFDEGKFHAASLFFLPCQSAFGESFFESHVGDKRLPLNPYHQVTRNFIELDAPKPTRAFVIEPTASSTPNFEKAAVARSKCLAAGPGERRVALYTYALSLRGNQFGAADADRELTSVAGEMPNSAKRLSEVRGLIQRIW